MANMEGFLECLELASGRQIWEERLKAVGPNSGSWSSMVLAGDKIYLLNQSSDTRGDIGGPNRERSLGGRSSVISSSGCVR